MTHATVTQILEEREGLQKLSVSRVDGGPGERAYALTNLTGRVEVGNRIVVNTTAVDLGLGTGGWHFVHWNLSNTTWSYDGGGHAIKLRYTSLQHNTTMIEEFPDYEAPRSLDGLPVVCCSLLSQVPAVVATYRSKVQHAKVALIVSDQNALALAMSDLVAEMRDKKLLDVTITCGQAFGGDHEAVTALSALGFAKAPLGADLVVITESLGSLGTSSEFGFSGLELARILDDVDWYGGQPIFALRWSGADERERHRGMSHHSKTVLRRAHRAIVAVPSGSDAHDLGTHESVAVDVPDVAVLFKELDLNVTTMGRSLDEDPQFFEYAAAAGALAAR